jgi:hypothetical protein
MMPASPANRELFCKSKYGQLISLIEKCTNLYNYCQECCDDIVPDTEKILNYDCHRSCVKAEKKRMSSKDDLDELED